MKAAAGIGEGHVAIVNTWHTFLAAQRAATCPLEKIPSRVCPSMAQDTQKVGAGRRVEFVKDDNIPS